MKLNLKKREEGSSLFVAMTICLIVGLILSGYLVLTSNRFQMTVRSSDWNAAIPVLEAGVEEAMTHLRRDTNTPTANNWTSDSIAGTQVYTKTRTFPDGSYFYVYIRDLSSNSATIYSQGFVRSPYNTKYISRTVKVGVTNPPTIFTHAIAANGDIAFVGQPTIAAFDSRLGPYNPATNRFAAGGLATNAKDSSAVSLGGANVYGPVSTGPGGSVSGGTVGDVAWNASHSGIEGPSWTNNTMNVSYPSNYPPIGGPYLAPTQFTNVTSGTYQMSSYSGDMTVSGNVTLYVTGDVTLKGQETITIKPGGSLTMIVGGNISMAGGGVLNGTGYAANFSILGLNSCTSISYTGNAAFVGTIYAPQADFSMKGTTDAYGAVIANSATMNGNTAFLFDMSLAYQDGYIVNSWQEL
jgi:putative adhesin